MTDIFIFGYNEKAAITVVLIKESKVTVIDMDYYSEIKSGYISAKKIFTALESQLSSTFKILSVPISIFELE